MDPDHLAKKLADALAAIVPQPFRVYEEQGMVMIEGGAAGRDAAEVAETVDEPGDPIGKATRAARESLATVQGYVVGHGLPA